MAYVQDERVLIHAEHIDKIYPGTKALKDVTFDVLKGKVNVLIGENGAGKSTLMKILAGVEQPSYGTIYMDGEEVSFKNIEEARKHGISIIFQELNLFPNLTVYQNMFMGREQTRAGSLDDAKHIAKTKEVMKRLEHDIDPHALVGDLRIGQQQIIEIARNLMEDNLRLLIMDEPTSSLDQHEIQILFRLIRELTAQGVSIVYISHRLEEIVEIGDHVTIFRDGAYVSDADVKDINVSWIVREMVGEDKKYPSFNHDIDWSARDVVLEVRDLALPKSGGGYVVDHVSFDLKQGEVLGIYGLLGAGRTELLECLMGLRPACTGTVKFHGNEIPTDNCVDQIKRGFALVPEDRQGAGLVQTLDIAKNISLSNMKEYAKKLLLSGKQEDSDVENMIDRIHIKVADKHLPILSLSGGNQQKVVIGKCLLTNPQVLLMDEPSRGIDIGAKTEVFEIIHKLAAQGLSIILVSSELEEIMSVTNRVIVLSNGKLTAEFDSATVKDDDLVLASYKGHHQDVEEEVA